jgi:hypothetical protein
MLSVRDSLQAAKTVLGAAIRARIVIKERMTTSLIYENYKAV